MQRLKDESIKQYKIRLFENKDKYDLTSQEIADLINKETGDSFTESTYRKWFTNFKDGFDYAISQQINNDDLLQEYENKKIELKKERIRLSDQRNNITKLIREGARFESIIDAIQSSVNIIAKEKPLIHITPSVIQTNNSAILMMSDWHYGIAVSNFLNEYNSEIFKQRIQKLTQETIDNCLCHKVETLHLALLGDFISSNIHQLLRIQNQVDIITQVQEVSEIIAQMINEFSKYFNIEIYSVSDNHGRITPNIKESLPTETFCRIIEWYLKARLNDFTNVHFNENEFGLEIATFNVYGVSVGCCHGNNDNLKDIVQNFTLMTKKFFDIILFGHLHHSISDEPHSVEIIGNPSLCGVDDYSFKLRLTSKPAQKLLIIEKDYGLKCIYTIKL